LVWERRIGGPAGAGDVALGVALGPSGGVLVAGRLATDAKTSDAVLVGLDPSDGEVAFQRTWSGTGEGLDMARAVASSPDGRVFVAGDVFNDDDGVAVSSSFIAGLDLEAGTQWFDAAAWSELQRAMDIVVLDEGRVCVGGYRVGDQFQGSLSCYALSGSPPEALAVSSPLPHGHATFLSLAPIKGGANILVLGDQDTASDGRAALGVLSGAPALIEEFSRIEGDEPDIIVDVAASKHQVLGCGRRPTDSEIEMGLIVDGVWQRVATEPTAAWHRDAHACSVAFDVDGHGLMGHGEVLSKYRGSKLLWTRAVMPGLRISDVVVDGAGFIYAVGLAPGTGPDDPSDMWMGKFAP